jgi:UDP-N-acetylglucosamine 2-epimerase (non-hydrolysing)
MVIFGTRPEAIKLAPVVRRLQESAWAEVVVCVTGQHRELLDQMLAVFDIKPQHDLSVMRNDQGLSETTAAILTRLSSVLQIERPAVLIAQGDTTTCFAGALAAYHQRIPVAHVEAGLRTWREYEPFPEEIHRQMVGRLARWHFAPTEGAKANLLREGVPADRVFVPGNTIVDALQHISAMLDAKRAGRGKPPVRISKGQRLLLVTAHRRESFGDGLRNICTALRRLVERNADLVVAYPVHPNPSVDGPVHRSLADNDRIRLIPPLDYLSFVALMRRAQVILTDSGGVQEEAPSLGVPVLVTRSVTERPEGVEAGVARLVGTDTDAIVTGVERWLHDDVAHARLRRMQNPYGDGHAAQRIVESLERLLIVQAPRASAARSAEPARTFP